MVNPDSLRAVQLQGKPHHRRRHVPGGPARGYRECEFSRLVVYNRPLTPQRRSCVSSSRHSPDSPRRAPSCSPSRRTCTPCGSSKQRGWGPVWRTPSRDLARAMRRACGLTRVLFGGGRVCASICDHSSVEREKRAVSCCLTLELLLRNGLG